MKINVYSYHNAIENLSDHKKNWISVRDLGYSNVYSGLDDNAENILELYFDDVTEQDIKTNTLHPFYQRAYMKRGLICFDDDMAKKIIEFSKDVFEKNEELNIHCWAGRSRSQAIGFCLNVYFNMFKQKNEIDYLRNIKYNMENFIGNYDVIRIMTNNLYPKHIALYSNLRLF